MTTAMLWCAFSALSVTSPFIDTTKYSRAQLAQMDEVICADGSRGESRVGEIALTSDGYVVSFAVGSRRVDIHVDRLKAILFCDGSRLERSPSHVAHLATNKSGEPVPCEPLRIWRMQNTFSIDYRSGTSSARNHLYRFTCVPLGPNHVIRPGSDFIVEGWGWQRLHVGMTREELERLYGPPEAVRDGQVLYSRGYGFYCWLRSDHVVEIRFDDGFSGRLFVSGTGLGATLDSILAAYGAPPRRIPVATRDEMSVNDGNLYTWRSMARIAYVDRGLLLWFSAGRVTQMVVFARPCTEFYVPNATGSFQTHRYEVVLTTLSWHEARDACLRRSGHLVTLTTAAEARYVESLCPAQWRIWLGMSDEGHEGIWRWITGEPLTYTNWQPGEPNNCLDQEHWCQLDTRTFFWNDLNRVSDGRIGYICEWDN